MYAITLYSIFHQNLHDFAFYDRLFFPVLLGTPAFSITFVLHYKQDFAIRAFVGIGLFAIPGKRVAHIASVPYLFSTEEAADHHRNVLSRCYNLICQFNFSHLCQNIDQERMRVFLLKFILAFFQNSNFEILISKDRQVPVWCRVQNTLYR